MMCLVFSLALSCYYLLCLICMRWLFYVRSGVIKYCMFISICASCVSRLLFGYYVVFANVIIVYIYCCYVLVLVFVVVFYALYVCVSFIICLSVLASVVVSCLISCYSSLFLFKYFNMFYFWFGILLFFVYYSWWFILWLFVFM